MSAALRTPDSNLSRIIKCLLLAGIIGLIFTWALNTHFNTTPAPSEVFYVHQP